jgi:hypothetical protein
VLRERVDLSRAAQTDQQCVQLCGSLGIGHAFCARVLYTREGVRVFVFITSTLYGVLRNAYLWQTTHVSINTQFRQV